MYQYTSWKSFLSIGALGFFGIFFIYHRYMQTGITRSERVENMNEQPLPVFLLIVCKGSDDLMETSLSRQMRQLTVLFKSAVSLTSTTLRFVIVSDSEELFESVKEIPSKWPEPYRSRLTFEHRAVWYPQDREYMKALLKPCSSAKLFIPETVTDVDAAVNIDTDTLFLHPPEELLKEIYKFNDKQAAGFAQTSIRYEGSEIPYPGPNGVNTGVMALNLTRLRAIPGGGWTGTNLNVFDRYRDQIRFTATNDIINILLSENMELLYDLSCVWNYTPETCKTGLNTCQKAESDGVSLIHGTGATFITDKYGHFKAVFEAWEEHQVGWPISSLLASIEKRFQEDKSSAIECNIVPNLSSLFTEALREKFNIM